MRGKSKPYEETHKIIDGITYKLCSDCTDWHPMTEEYFYKNKSAPDGFNPYCKSAAIKRQQVKYWADPILGRQKKKEWRNNNKESHKLMMKEWDEKNKEHLQEYQSNWRKENPDKIRGYNDYRNMNKKHEISKKEKEDCKAYFNYCCSYCGISESEAKKTQGQNLHMDHVNPNGANDLSNNIPACKSCNCSKHDKLLEDWYKPNNEPWCNVYSDERLQKILKWLNEDYKLYIKENNQI